MFRTSRRFNSEKMSSLKSRQMVDWESKIRSLGEFGLIFSEIVFFFVYGSVDMAPLYETLVAGSVLEMDQSVLDSMRAKIDEELKKVDEK